MATLKEIGEKANVSTTTVSRVLSDDVTLKIPIDKRMLIKEIAQEMGYSKKNTSKNNTISRRVAIVSWYNFEKELDDPYFFYIREGAQKYLRDRNIETEIYFQDDVISEIKTYDAIIAIGIFSEQRISQLEKLCNRIIFIDSSPDYSKYISIQIDFSVIVDQVIHYININEISDVGFIGGYKFLENGEKIIDLRESLFREKLGILYDENNFKIGHYNFETGYNAISEFTKVPKFIFCANDHIAIGALKKLSELGISVPNDVEIIGFNNIEIAKYMIPGITTFSVDQSTLGREAAKIAYQVIVDDEYKPFKTYFPTKIINRNTTKNKVS